MTFHPAIREAMAVHEAFRLLEFKPEEIFLVLQGTRLFVTVRRDGKEFNAQVGEEFQATREILAAHWEQASHAWNVTMSEAERRDIYDNSLIKKLAGPFVAAVMAKGFSIAPIDA